MRDQIRALRRELTDTMRSIYSKLDPWETVQVARHPDRPMFTDYLDLVFDEFVELHGDKFFGDDRALRTGFAKLDELQGDASSAIRKARRSKNATSATSAAPIPKAIARRWQR